jgi:hypothetical protein
MIQTLAKPNAEDAEDTEEGRLVTARDRQADSIASEIIAVPTGG